MYVILYISFNFFLIITHRGHLCIDETLIVNILSHSVDLLMPIKYIYPNI